MKSPESPQKFFQHRTVVVRTVPDPERKRRNVRNRDIPEIRLSGRDDVGVQSVPHLSPDKGQSRFYIFGKIALCRQETDKDLVLKSENLVSDLAGRADNDAPGQVAFREQFILCQRMLRRSIVM